MTIAPELAHGRAFAIGRKWAVRSFGQIVHQELCERAAPNDLKSDSAEKEDIDHETKHFAWNSGSDSAVSLGLPLFGGKRASRTNRPRTNHDSNALCVHSPF